MKTLVILTALCFVLAGISLAGNVTLTEVVTGGTLTLTMPNNFSLSTVTLGGESYKIATNSGDYGQHFFVEDSRGTGAGWNLGFQISQFTTGGTNPRTLETDKFYMSQETQYLTCEYGQAIDATNGPKSLILSPTVVGAAETKLVQALAGYGMGKYEISANHAVVVMSYVYAGTYTATLTATLNATP